MCLGIMAIGLLVVFWASKWRIVVNGDRMEIQRLLRKTITMQIDEIERVKNREKEPDSFIPQQQKADND